MATYVDAQGNDFDLAIEDGRAANAQNDNVTIANNKVDLGAPPAYEEINDVRGVHNKGNPDGTPIGMEMAGGKVDEVSVDPDNAKYSKLKRQSTFGQQREIEEDDWINKILTPYSTFLVRFPSVIITLSIIIIALSVVLAIVKDTGGKGVPSFDKPIKGYEARGTEMANKRIAAIHLEKALEKNALSTKSPGTRKKRSIFASDLFARKLPDYVEDFRFVLEHESGDNLFDHMVPVCQWYKEKIKTQPNYDTLTAPYTRSAHHIPNYIALLSNKDDCEDITTADVARFKSLLVDCVGYYKNNSLFDCIANGKCSTISNRCKVHTNLTVETYMTALLYNVFQYFGDSKLKNNPNNLKLTATAVVIFPDEPFFYSVYQKSFLDLEKTKHRGIKAAAFTMRNLKFHAFSKEIITQSALLIIAVIIVILLGWFFSGSFFLGLMTLGCIIAAMLISFFVYNRIFNMSFFPFLNITVLIFIIGIGADDVFVYTGEWGQAKEIYKIYDASLRQFYLIKWTTHTLRHAAVSMFVTSVTTAAAFYANISSDVTAVKCFGLFSGTAIIVNYLLMITLFPCCVVIHEKYFSRCMHFCCPCICERLPVIRALVEPNSNNEEIDQSNVQKCKAWLSKVVDVFFNKYLPQFLYFTRYFFLIVFFILGIAGVVVAFAKPGLNPPSTKSFQMFTSDTSIEQYDLYIKNKFDAGQAGEGQMSIDYVFGVEPVDNGDLFDPDKKGSLVLKKGELPIASKSNQIWLKSFCENIEKASFYQSSDSCNRIGSFFESLSGDCNFGFPGCCNRSLPLPSKEFMDCFYKVWQSNPGYGIYQPLYSNSELKTFSIKVQSKYEVSRDYFENKRIVEEINSWTSGQTRNVSSSFRPWWWADRALEFYDLQNSLYTGTKISLGIAIGVAFVVILLTSMHIILSIFSVVTILFIISITVGILIGDGWKLNIVESTVFSVAAGLSADFTMHYSIAYKESLFKGDRKKRTEDAISHIGPAMFMGALTTFVGGVVMYPSTVLAYKQFGTFLMVVMFVSWLYSNFFFLPLLDVMGPVNSFGQIRCPRKKETPPEPSQDGQSNKVYETTT